MDQLTEDVLVYSRVSRTELPLVPVELGALVEGIVESYPQFHAAHADIEVRGPLPRVLGNEAALMQCVSNLPGNVVEFVAPGVRPRVEVPAEIEGARKDLWDLRALSPRLRGHRHRAGGGAPHDGI